MARVATAICSSCHVNGPEQKEAWQRIAQTAGHRVHFESDSSALAEVEGVTCHGQEVHKFVPVTETCPQSGRPGRLPGPVGNVMEAISPVLVRVVEDPLSVSAQGSPASVRRALAGFIDRYAPDEIMLNGNIHDPAARKRSFEIAAEVMQTLEPA